MVKVILKRMVLKIIEFFKWHIDILKQLVLMIVIFYHRNLKDCLMKVLSLLLRLIKCLILVSYVGTKARVKFNGDCSKQEKISFDHMVLGLIEKDCFQLVMKLVEM